MSQEVPTVPPKGLWALKASDFAKGLWLSVGSGVIAFGYFLLDKFRMPTVEEAKPYIITIGAGFLSYIGKNLTTNNVGQMFKKDKPVTQPYSAPNDNTANT